MTADDLVAAILRQHNLRNTAARRAVLKAFLSRKNASEHVTAHTITARVRASLPAINKSTVYRALDAFVEHGLLTTTNLGELTNRFQLAVTQPLQGSAPHTCARCISCQRILDLPATALTNLSTYLDAEHGFRIAPARTVVIGHCAECRSSSAHERTGTPAATS